MNNQKYRIKVVEGQYNTFYYPQYYQEPLVIFGLTIFKGDWKNFTEAGAYAEGGTFVMSFNTINEAKMFLKREKYEDKISYVDYQ